MKLLKKIFCNSWVKTLFFIGLCIGTTYVIVVYFTPQFITLFNWRSKGFWTTLAILIPVIYLLPTFVNMFFFLKIVQIADNTHKTTKLLQKQIKLLEKTIKK